MLQMPIAVLALLQLVPTVAAAEDAHSTRNSPAEQYESLVEEYEDVGGAGQFAERFFVLAEKHSKDPVAVDALLWVVKNRRNRPDGTRALEFLTTRHLDSEKLGPACRGIARTPSTGAQRLLRALLENSPHQEVLAAACLSLSALLEDQAKVVEQLRRNPDLAERVLQYYGEDYGRQLASLDRAKLEKELEKVYERMRESFADVEIGDETMGGVAETALFRIRHLSVGRVAPEIEGEDIFGDEFKLSDFRGKVVVLSFWGHW